MPDSPPLNPATPPQHWGAQALWQQLEPLLPGLSIEVVASTDSTNSQLIERARRVGNPRHAREAEAATPHPGGRRAIDLAPCLLVAEQQTRGRGRLGREWQSRAGRSLTFSLTLPLAPPDWSGLSLAVGVTLAEALDPSGRVGVKWPNDLWLRDGPGVGRKLAGVLIETVAVAERRVCVVGVGINVLPQAAEDPEALGSGYACLQELNPEATAPRALACVALPLVRALCRFEAEGFAPFAPAFERHDLLRGLPVSTSAPQTLQGVAEGVDERGALRVRAGELYTLISGEVSVRLQGAA